MSLERIADHRNLTERVYGSLKQSILDNRIPPGTKLRENELKDKLGVSNTPIRAALHRLGQEGLVEGVPRRGFFVIREHAATFEEMLDLREVLEGLAVRYLARLSDRQGIVKDLRASLEESWACLRRRDHNGYVHTDIRFHEIIRECLASEKLKAHLRNLFDYIRVLRMWGIPSLERMRTSLREHRAVLAAIERGNPAQAERAMRAHLDTAKRALRGKVDR
jgi:DNA-binding GntR family transcriptional regulator